MPKSYIVLLIIIAILIGAFFASDLQQWLALDTLKAKQQTLLAYCDAHPVKATAFYALFYIAMTAPSLPGGALLTLAGGALFGLLWGTLIVSFASSIGATLAFLAARFLFRGLVKAKFADRVKAVDEGMARAGAAGLTAAYIAAVKADVTLVEKHKMGGECLNTGCVPSKALLRSAKLLAQCQRSAEFGIHGIKADFDFAEIMERVQQVIKTVAPHDSVERYRELGVNVIEGAAKIISPWAVEVATATGRRTLTTRAIIIATGSRPFIG